MFPNKPAAVAPGHPPVPCLNWDLVTSVFCGPWPAHQRCDRTRASSPSSCPVPPPSTEKLPSITIQRRLTTSEGHAVSCGEVPLTPAAPAPPSPAALPTPRHRHRSTGRLSLAPAQEHLPVGDAQNPINLFFWISQCGRCSVAPLFVPISTWQAKSLSRRSAFCSFFFPPPFSFFLCIYLFSASLLPAVRGGSD